MYIAMIGDIIASKQLADRQAVQLQLQNVLQRLNQEYQEEFASPLTITLGDEFQVLFRRGEKVFEVIDKIKFALFPVAVRFGLGLGEITTAINPLVSLGADGPAYWWARQAITQVHQESQAQPLRLLLLSEGRSSELDLLNDSLRLCDFMESRWRDTQRELAQLCVLSSGHGPLPPQKELAGQLQITTQAVNQRLQSSGLPQYLQLKQSLTASLLHLWEIEA